MCMFCLLFDGLRLYRAAHFGQIKNTYIKKKHSVKMDKSSGGFWCEGAGLTCPVSAGCV